MNLTRPAAASSSAFARRGYRPRPPERHLHPSRRHRLCSLRINILIQSVTRDIIILRLTYEQLSSMLIHTATLNPSITTNTYMSSEPDRTPFRLLHSKALGDLLRTARINNHTTIAEVTRAISTLPRADLLSAEFGIVSSTIIAHIDTLFTLYAMDDSPPSRALALLSPHGIASEPFRNQGQLGLSRQS